MNLFNVNEIFGDILGAKALRNTENKRTDALLRAQRAEVALQTYPFDDISTDIVIKINPRAKRMALRVDPKKRVINLVVPKRGSMREAYLFSLEHKYWIKKKLAELPRKISFKHGTTVPLLGKDRTIEICFDNTLKATDIVLKNNKLLVFTNRKNPATRIKRYIIQLAKERLFELSTEKAATIRKKVVSVDVKDTTSRWGSCSHDGKLCYSWRLIFAPMSAFDYVVSHEVAHLRFMDHSPAFWLQCEYLSEDYSAGRNWMKHNSCELLRYS